MTMRRILFAVPLLALLAALFAASAWYWLLHTQSGARWAWQQATSATGGLLDAAQVRGDLAGGVILSGVVYDAAAAHVSIDELRLSADVDLLPLVVTATDAEARGIGIRLKPGADSVEQTAPLDFRNTLEALRLPFELAVSDLTVSAARIDGLIPDRSLAIETASLAGRWKNAIEIETLAFRMPGIDVQAGGRMALYDNPDIAVDVEVVPQPEITGLERPLTIGATARGPLDNIAIRVTTDAPAATLTGTLSDVTTAPKWNLRLEAPRLTLPDAVGLPDTPPLSVVATGEGSLQSFRAEAQVALLGTTMQAGFDAVVDLADSVVSGDLSWEDARWPLDDEPRIRSRKGRVTVSGSLDNWQVSGTVAVKIPDVPTGQFTFRGEGDRDRAAVAITDGEVLGGRISGSADYRWRGQGEGSATLKLENVLTAALLPEWPAELSGHVDLTGRQDLQRLTATITDVRGTLRDRPLRASGRIEVIDNLVAVENVAVEHGRTRVVLDGQPYTSPGLTFDLVVDELGDYFDRASGSVAAAGVISLDAKSPLLRLNGSSSAITWDDLRVEDLAISDRNNGTRVFAADVRASVVALGEVSLDQVQLDASVDKQSQSFELAVSHGEFVSQVSLTGLLDSWDEPSSWSGTIEGLDLENPDFTVGLIGPADIELTPTSARIGQVCMDGSNEIHVCFRGSLSGSDEFDLRSEVLSLPLRLVNSFVDTRLDFDQVVEGELSWRRTPGSRAKGRVDLRMSSGRLASVDQPELALDTGNATLSFDTDDDDVLSGVLDLPLNDAGAIGGNFEIRDLADGHAGTVSGGIDIDITDIGIFAAVLPIVDNAAGNLRADLSISGSPTQPSVVGDIAFSDGHLSYLPIGLDLEEIELTGSLLERGEVELNGSFRAGEGRARLTTRTDHMQTTIKGVEIKLQGDNLTLIDVPDLRANAKTDIGVVFNGKTLRLSGRIEIPNAKITPSDLGSGSVVESGDVVVVAGSLPDDDRVSKDDGLLEMYGSLELVLGDDVVVDLERARANLTGSAVFTWDGEYLPNAEGVYTLSGEIIALGQRLDISEGKIRFPNVRADSPNLRIRAEREIFGNTEIRTAGVLVDGPAKSPLVEPYTIPLTTRERALTLLVTGSDFDLERGVGAVDFGTYVAPRVYASYGIGLFDEQNVIRIRYDLARGFGVTATSGQRDSGVDLTYRVDR